MHLDIQLRGSALSLTICPQLWRKVYVLIFFLGFGVGFLFWLFLLLLKGF